MIGALYARFHIVSPDFALLRLAVRSSESSESNSELITVRQVSCEKPLGFQAAELTDLALRRWPRHGTTGTRILQHCSRRDLANLIALSVQ